jgi:hypothetical protein
MRSKDSGDGGMFYGWERGGELEAIEAVVTSSFENRGLVSDFRL